jgi:hypothetical protein
MATDRRDFVRTVAAAAAGAALVDRLRVSPFVLNAAADIDMRLLPSADEVWGWQTWMAKLGPKYTGNAAHRTFVEFLAKEFTALSLDVARDHHTLPMWEARRTAITAQPSAAASFEVPVASYYPYSGKTSDRGVSGRLLYVGKISAFDRNFKWRLPSDAGDTIVLVDFENPPMPYEEWWRPLGFYTRDTKFPTAVNATWTTRAPLLADVKQAGVRAVIFNQVSLSEDHAAFQYAPFGRPFQDLPALWVGAEAGKRLRAVADGDGSATVRLEADVTPDTATDTLIATLPGQSADEAIIINTHTDGPNATEENGALGLLAMAKYFSRMPAAARKRTLVFVATTGHFAGAYVPGIRSIVEKHPDLIRKAVAAVTVEHLGCREWLDVGSKYKATGLPELTLVITEFDSTAKVMLDAFEGSSDRRSAVVTPTPSGGFNGEGGALSRAGIPTIGYIPIPSYLLAGPPNGCIEKLDPKHLHAEIQVLTKVVRQLDGMSRAELSKGGRMATRATAG